MIHKFFFDFFYLKENIVVLHKMFIYYSTMYVKKHNCYKSATKKTGMLFRAIPVGLLQKYGISQR